MKDGEKVTHQDHFKCTITCGFCRKMWHFEDECHIKKRESDKLKRQEAERQMGWQRNGKDPKKEVSTPTGGGIRWSAPPAPSTSTPSSSAPQKRPPSSPAKSIGPAQTNGGGSTPNGECNAKKRKLAY